MSFHNCAHDHTWQCQPCTSAKVFEGRPSPLVQQRIPLQHKRRKKNNQEHDVQERSTMVASVYQQRLDSAQWTCIALFPLSNHVLCQLCRTGTCQNQWSTWKKKKKGIMFKTSSLEILLENDFKFSRVRNMNLHCAISTSTCNIPNGIKILYPCIWLDNNAFTWN